MSEYRGLTLFVECVEDKSVMIGFTTNKDARLAKIRFDKAPKEIVLLGYLDGPRSIKKEMHEKFKKLQIFSSWFHLTDEFREWIEIFTKHEEIPSGHIAEEVKEEEVKRSRREMSKAQLCTTCGSEISEINGELWCLKCKADWEARRTA